MIPPTSEQCTLRMFMLSSKREGVLRDRLSGGADRVPGRGRASLIVSEVCPFTFVNTLTNTDCHFVGVALCGTLRAHPDTMIKSPKNETTVERTLLVDAAPEAVWKALVEPRLVRQYMGATPTGEIAVGQPIQWFARVEEGGALVAKGTVLAVQPGERLRYTTYATTSKLPDEPASRTTVDLHLIPLDDGGTRVELWQGDFAGLPHDVRLAREAGRVWVEQLVGLKRVAEEVQGAMAA